MFPSGLEIIKYSTIADSFIPVYIYAHGLFKFDNELGHGIQSSRYKR